MKPFFDKGNQHVSGDGAPHLRLHCILAVADKTLDAQVVMMLAFHRRAVCISWPSDKSINEHRLAPPENQAPLWLVDNYIRYFRFNNFKVRRFSERKVRPYFPYTSIDYGIFCADD